MPPSPDEVPNLWQYLDSFQKTMAEVHASLTNPQQKEVLGELLAKVQESREEVQKLVPPLIDEMRQKNEAMKSWAESALPQVEQQRRELQARMEAAADQAKRPPAPARAAAAAPPQIDPNRGAVLGGELMDRFGRQQVHSAPADEGGSVWSHFDDIDAAPAAVPEPPPPILPHRDPPPPPRRKTIVPTSNDANLWSHIDDDDQQEPPPKRDEMDQSEKGFDQ